MTRMKALDFVYLMMEIEKMGLLCIVGPYCNLTNTVTLPLRSLLSVPNDFS